MRWGVASCVSFHQDGRVIDRSTTHRENISSPNKITLSLILRTFRENAGQWNTCCRFYRSSL